MLRTLHPARVPAPELKRLPVAPSVSADGAIEGYASLFGVVDLGRDRVERGAFAASLKRRGARGVRFLFQHDPAEPIGAWTSISEDVRGLRVSGRLNMNVVRAREVHALLRQGALDGLSIGFRAVRSLRGAGGVRRLIEVDLWEISVVTFPMLPDARVAAVKRDPLIPPSKRGGWPERTSVFRSSPSRNAHVGNIRLAEPRSGGVASGSG